MTGATIIVINANILTSTNGNAGLPLPDSNGYLSMSVYGVEQLFLFSTTGGF